MTPLVGPGVPLGDEWAGLVILYANSLEKY